MILYLFNVNIDGIDEVAVEGTNFFKTLSYAFPKFDNDNLLDPRRKNKDGSLHEGTKIRSYLLKQENVKYIDVWDEVSEYRQLLVPDVVSIDSFKMYKRNSSLILYYGEFVNKCIEWFMPYSQEGTNFYIKNDLMLTQRYTSSYLNKVQDATAKKYSNTRSLLF